MTGGGGGCATNTTPPVPPKAYAIAVCIRIGRWRSQNCHSDDIKSKRKKPKHN